MSEQDKMTEQETEVTTPGEIPQEEKKPEVPTRSMILMILAGCYLLYTGYRLCKNVLDGVEGTDHQGNTAGRRKEDHEYCRTCKTCRKSG